MLNFLGGVRYEMTQCIVDPSFLGELSSIERMAPMDRLDCALGQKAVLTDPLMSEAAFVALACLGLYNQ